MTAEQKASQAVRAEQERINAEARQYLDSTDWYVTRFRETGAEIPDDVRVKRQAARDRVVQLDD
ncbi:hypothetical protein GY634_13430 [Paenalcaligenes suwonensis]|nr:hypothetical protein [Paenalcaligenes suwonensis]